MSWKQTVRYSFADALLIEHKSLSRLDDVHEIINWKQIVRYLMFRRFIGLSLSEAVPDHSTIWRFRNRLHTENLLDSLIGADQSSAR